MTANKTRHLTIFAGTFLLLGSAVSARADYVFNFNSLAASSGDNSTAVATYMDGVLGCANCVTVTGAATDRTYNGEGFVVGPGGVSRTLGNTDGATDNSSAATATTNDTFLANTTDGSSQISQQITIKFTHGFVINGPVSFDYEVFPDISGAPDFKFATNGNVGSPLFTTLGVTPGTTNGSSTHSPNHPSTSETAKQFIGTWSGTLTNVTELDFIDWPATIGVDNLKIVTPEPRGVTFLLGAFVIAALAGIKVRHAFAKS